MLIDTFELSSEVGITTPFSKSFYLPSGCYKVTPVSNETTPAFNSYNGWAGAVTKKPDGQVDRGWLNIFRIYISGTNFNFGAANPQENDPTRVYRSNDSTRYETASEAFENSVPICFEITAKLSFVTITLPHSGGDDIGGMTFELHGI